MAMIRIPVGRRVFAPSWLMTLLALALMLLFIRLGDWQWDRGEHAQQERVAFLAGGAPPAPLGDQDTRLLPRFSHVAVTGELDGAHQFLLDNRSHAGMPGYEVLTPLDLSDGRILLVDRGWVAFTGSRARLPQIALDPGMTRAALLLTGRLDGPPVGGLKLGHAAPATSGPWPRLTSFPTMAELSASLGKPVGSRVLLLDATAPAGYVRDWQLPGMGPERHWSYAVQWWGFAVTLSVIWLIMSTRPTPSATRPDA